MDKIIGMLMRIYRRSPLHSEKVGKVLAKILVLAMPVKKDQKKTKEINGVVFELDLRQVIDASLFYSNTFEEQVEHLIHSTITPGMIAIDIGANIGYHTFRIARLVKENGVVYAIEPTHRAYSRLIRNAELNPSIRNIRFLKYALGDYDAGLVQVIFESSYRLDNNEDKNTELVEMLKLDTVVEKEKISRVDFIKIDVDGMEAKIVKGAHRTLSTMFPTLLMEINPYIINQNGDDHEEMVNVLEKLGYKFRAENGRIIQDLKAYCRKTYTSSTMVLAERSS